MQGRHVRWLFGELEGLVGEGILDRPAAERLRRHYRDRQADPVRWRELIFAVLGAVLVGGGVILLLAHNWSELTRPVRAMISFLPLLLAQALAALTLLRHRENPAWREGVGIAVSLAVASSIALIGQTYQIPGDLESFLLTWALLTLPVVYVLNAVTPAVIYLATSLSWAFTSSFNGHDPEAVWLWGLLALVGPFVARRLQGRTTGGQQVLAWAATVVLALAPVATWIDGHSEVFVIFLALTFAWLWLEGEERRRDGRSWLLSPFSLVGGLAVVGHALLASFDDTWGFLTSSRTSVEPKLEGAWILLLVAILGVGRWAWLTFRAGRSRHFGHLAVALWPVVVSLLVAAVLSGGPRGEDLAGLGATLFLGALGLAALGQGFQEGSAGWANVGLGVLALLIVVRFFDSDLPLLFRGVAFVVVGVVFLVANRLLSRRLRVAVGGEA